MIMIFPILAALIAGAVVLMRVMGNRSSGAASKDLGTLSHAWLAEQRLGRKSDLS